MDHANKENINDKINLFCNISIWIDTYEDIFSDFDPRPISERRLSDDFLTEVKKVCREKEEDINELKLLIPEKSRNIQDETVIIRRLHAHFKRNHTSLKEEIKSIKRKGLLFTFTGMTMMFTATFVSTFEYSALIKNALRVLMEPSGWFLIWMGLENFFYSSGSKKIELEFYSKMGKSKIVFIST